MKESRVNEVTGTGDVYTMAEAARLKGVSYHTVSRAVRRGKLPATRLGRMALITSEDLRDWRPMRERAPRKYRRREPNPEATPALLDLASAERVELASRLGTYGPPLTNLPDSVPIDDSPLALDVSRPPKAVVEDLMARAGSAPETINVNSLLIAPIRIGDRYAGVIVADRNGEPFRLNEGELDLAQAMANVAALALDRARARQAAAVS